MTSPAWDRAVNPLQAAVGAMRHAHWLTARRRPEPSVPLADDQYASMARAALPHLLRGIVGEIEDKGVLAIQMARACDVSVGQPDVDGRTVGEIIAGRLERLLLAALTDAAGRVGG